MRRTVSASLAGIVVAAAAASPAHASPNGRLQPSELAAIHHPQHRVYLRKDAAAAWNALRRYCLARGVDIYVKGPNSAYRTYEQQVLMKRIYGKNAATPGRSNHGLGLAVDLATPAMRKAIDNWGARFGWSKRWSDASWEWWHIKYQPGHYSGADPGPGGGGATPPREPGPTTTDSDGDADTGPSTTTGIANALDPSYRPLLARGSRGEDVRKLQEALSAKGFGVAEDGVFGPATERAVRAFQRAKGLGVDGVVGPETWRALLAR